VNQSGIVLRGQGSAGDGATTLRVSAPLKTAISLGPYARRQSEGDKIPITDVYVPVGARAITVSQTNGLAVGDEIIVFRPKTQKWICAIDTDVLPSRTDGRATPPWKPKGALTFERRIVAIEGNRIILDVPLTNALEKEFTAAYITKMAFPERLREVGVEGFAVEGLPVGADRCPSTKHDFLRVNAVEDGWIRDLRVRGFAGEAVSLGFSSKRITVSDVSYTVTPGRRCRGFGFKLGGQQNLILRGRTSGPHITAVITDTEVEGPNAVVDFVAVGRGHVRMRVASRWSTGILFDNVNIEDELGVPSGDFDLARGRTTHGWSAVNSVLWNSNAEKLSVDNPPTARNWILGGGVGAQALLGTGTYGPLRGPIEPRSLYQAQLRERLGMPPASLRTD